MLIGNWYFKENEMISFARFSRTFVPTTFVSFFSFFFPGLEKSLDIDVFWIGEGARKRKSMERMEASENRGRRGRRSIFQVHVSQPHLIYPLFLSPFPVLHSHSLLLSSLTPILFYFLLSLDPLFSLPLPSQFFRVVFRPPPSPPYPSTCFTLLWHSTTLHNHPRKPFELSNPLWISPYATYHGFRMFSVRTRVESVSTDKATRLRSPRLFLLRF